jgi:hypothetical protein
MSKRSQSPLLVGVAAALGGADLPAQFQRSGGPFAGVGIAVTVDGSTVGPSGTPISPNELLVKKPGFFAPSAHGASVPNRPDFRQAAILQGIPGIRIAAMSIGRDVVSATNDGRVAIPPNGWGAILFNVHRDSNGMSPRLAGEKDLTADGAAADLFGYVLPGSNLPASWIDVTHRALNSDELGLFQRTGPGTGNQGDIQAVDCDIPLYELDDELLVTMTAGSPLPAEPTFYFTVSKDTLDAVPMAWWLGGGKSAATILCTKWNKTTMQWAQPSVFIGFASFAFGPGVGIDGLAIEERDQQILLSTDDPTRVQLEFVSYAGKTKPIAGALTVWDYRTTTDAIIAESTGGGTGVGDFCTRDPGQALVGQPGVDPWCFGAVRDTKLPWPERANASVFRSCDAGGNPTIETFVTGFGPGGRPSVMPPNGYFAALLVDFESYDPVSGTWASPLPLFLPLATYAIGRLPMGFQGDPQGVAIPLPSSHIAFRGDLRLVCRWAVLDLIGIFSSNDALLLM